MEYIIADSSSHQLPEIYEDPGTPSSVTSQPQNFASHQTVKRNRWSFIAQPSSPDPSGRVFQDRDLLDSVFESVETTVCRGPEGHDVLISAGRQVARTDPPCSQKLYNSNLDNSMPETRQEEMTLTTRECSKSEDGEREGPTFSAPWGPSSILKYSAASPATLRKNSNKFKYDEHNPGHVGFAISKSEIDTGKLSHPETKQSLVESTMADEENSIVDTRRQVVDDTVNSQDDSFARAELKPSKESNTMNVHDFKKDMLDILFENVEGFVCRERELASKRGHGSGTNDMEDLENGSTSSSPIKLHKLATPQPSCESNGLLCAAPRRKSDAKKQDVRDSLIRVPEAGQEQTLAPPRVSRFNSLLEMTSSEVSDSASIEQSGSGRLEQLRSKKRELEKRVTFGGIDGKGKTGVLTKGGIGLDTENNSTRTEDRSIQVQVVVGVAVAMILTGSILIAVTFLVIWPTA